MNAKSKMKVLHNESAIEMNKTFAKMVENPFSEEYAVKFKRTGRGTPFSFATRVL